MRLSILICALAVQALALPSARASTYKVGPARTYKTLHAVAPALHPGDVVEVDGDATYPGGFTFRNHGTAVAPITVRGIRVNGNRPKISGVGGWVGGVVARFWGNHYVFDGFDISVDGDTNALRCVYIVADDVTLRDCVVHDSAMTGISSSDISGSVKLQHVEVHHCGAGTLAHQIYVGSGNTTYPNAVFRMEFCYIHDGAGGNNVKSRVGRNEIYYNWIEGAVYHELDLIGADPAGGAYGGRDLVREDSDVVGNVLMKMPSSLGGGIARLGSDGTGSSNGRYRFVSNTIILPAAPVGATAVFWLKDRIESIESDNNIFYRLGGGKITVGGAPYRIAGANNWVTAGALAVPAAWVGTRTGLDPAMKDPAVFDFAPLINSPLFGGANFPTAGPAGFEIPTPLPAPLFLPPPRAIYIDLTPVPRPDDGAPDIGAIETPAPAAEYLPPVAVDDIVDFATVTVSVPVLANDSSPIGATIALTSFGQGKFGAVARSGDSLVYTPSRLFTGGDSFSYLVTDGTGAASATVRVRNPFLVTRGSYEGLAADSPQTNAGSGYLRVTTLATGTFSGLLKFGGGTFAISGAFDLAGNWHGVVARAGKTPLNIALHIDLQDGSDTVTGTIDDGSVVSGVVASRWIFTAAHTTPLAGKYTLLLPDPALRVFPPGGGYATLTLSGIGGATLTGRLSDGTAFSSATYLRPDGSFPIYAVVYGAPAGSFTGFFSLRENPGVSDGSGTFTWFKPAQRTGTIYRDGFTLSLDAIASRYTPPVAGVRVLNFADSGSNGLVGLSAGNLAVPLQKTITLSSTNTFTVDAPGADALALTLAPLTGAFIGSFVHPVSHVRATFSGAVFQMRNTGAGVFLGTTESGAVSISPAP